MTLQAALSASAASSPGYASTRTKALRRQSTLARRPPFEANVVLDLVQDPLDSEFPGIFVAKETLSRRCWLADSVHLVVATQWRSHSELVCVDVTCRVGRRLTTSPEAAAPSPPHAAGHSPQSVAGPSPQGASGLTLPSATRMRTATGVGPVWARSALASEQQWASHRVLDVFGQYILVASSSPSLLECVRIGKLAVQEGHAYEAQAHAAAASGFTLGTGEVQ